MPLLYRVIYDPCRVGRFVDTYVHMDRDFDSISDAFQGCVYMFRDYVNMAPLSYCRAECLPEVGSPLKLAIPLKLVLLSGAWVF